MTSEVLTFLQGLQVSAMRVLLIPCRADAQWGTHVDLLLAVYGLPQFYNQIHIDGFQYIRWTS